MAAVRGQPTGRRRSGGKLGARDGDFLRPWAIAIDRQDRLFIVDFSARIRVFDRDGKYLGPTWTTPDYRSGRPSGLSIDRDGHLLVSDSHYNCFRIYDEKGTLLRTFSGQAGTGPGQLGYVSDVVQDADGFFYVGEFGETGRISVFDPEGRFLRCWGSAGVEPVMTTRNKHDVARTTEPDGRGFPPRGWLPLTPHQRSRRCCPNYSAENDGSFNNAPGHRLAWTRCRDVEETVAVT